MIRIPEKPLRSITVMGLILSVQIGVGMSLSSTAAGQKRGGVEEPVFREYRCVQIGMIADEARKKLGGPKDKGDDQDFFVFSDNETATVQYDKQHKVITISTDYLSGATGIPTAASVIGSEISARADGSLYKMVRYEKAGFWVSYSRTAGATPMTSVTIQKIQ